MPHLALTQMESTYEAKIKAVVLGSRIRMITAAKRFCTEGSLGQPNTVHNNKQLPPCVMACFTERGDRRAVGDGKQGHSWQGDRPCVLCLGREEVYTNRIVLGVAGVQRNGLQVQTAVEVDRCNDVP